MAHRILEIFRKATSCADRETAPDRRECPDSIAFSRHGDSEWFMASAVPFDCPLAVSGPGAAVTGTTDRDMLGYGFVGRLQSIGDGAMVTADNTGKLLTLKKLR